MRTRVPAGVPEVLDELLASREASGTRLRAMARAAWPRWDRLAKWLLAQGLVTMRTLERGKIVEKRFRLTSHGRKVARAYARAHTLVDAGPLPPARRARNGRTGGGRRPGKS